MWEFLDYINGDGKNVIRDWIDGLSMHGKQVKAKLNVRLAYLSAVDLSKWNPPQARALHGECEGLYEIRFQIRGIPYRPLCFVGPREGEATLLMGAIEREDRFEPRTACGQALDCRDVIMDDNGKVGNAHIQPHDFS